MEDSEAPRPTFPAQVIGTENDAGSRPRIEIVIRTETVTLTVDGNVTVESVAALAALANGLRTTSPTGMEADGSGPLPTSCDELKLAAQGAGDHPAGPPAELPRPDKQAAEASGQARSRAITRFRRGVTATFLIAKDIVTELIARLLGHVLRFPP
jgi:hypothetical protein